MDTSELIAKTEEYQAEIAAMEAEIATLDESKMFHRIHIVELRTEIENRQARIARLQRRIAGTPEPGSPTDDQLQSAAYVLSPAYDN